MNIKEFYEKTEELYPRSLSCAWDNDGLMCSPGAVYEVERVLVCLDATEDAVQYAAENGFDTILCHHPMIFSGLKSVTPENSVGRKVICALMNNISVISLHTRLDAGEGGVNDALASALGLENVRKFGDAESPELGRIGEIKEEMTLLELASHVKAALNAPRVELSCADSDDKVKTVAVVGGSGKEFVFPAKAAGADVIVIGEGSYNFILDAAQDEMNVITAGHFYTEDVVCKKLAVLAKEIAGAEVEIYNSNMIITL
ncbi:MAG: Nif3-like dinuclear metal center hexameric protein [Ruminococcaceae bacterium]|nr:Nif3-like dinuclear metal center hexameric protein [Oscillospiraceae bacterium]